MSKKAARNIIIVVLAVVLLAVIVTYAAFSLLKPQITTMVKQKASEALVADLYFDDLRLRFWRTFPNLGISLDGLTIVTREPFAGDTLLWIDRVDASVGLPKLVFSRQVEVKSLEVRKPRLILLRSADGRVNWRIFPEKQAGPVKPAPAAASAIALTVRKYDISDADIVFRDDSVGIVAEILDLDHEGKGDFARGDFTLSSRASISALNVAYKKMRFLNQARLEAIIDLDVFAAQRKVVLRDNRVRLNDLTMQMSGWLQAMENETQMDVIAKAASSDFKQLLSVVSPLLSGNFAQVQASGRMQVEAKVIGAYRQGILPAFRIDVMAEEGRVQHPKAAVPVEEVHVDLRLTNPGGPPDSTILDLKRFHFRLGEGVFDTRLYVSNPVSDPYLDASVEGRVDLVLWRQVMQSTSQWLLGGMADGTFKFRGRKSAVLARKTNAFDLYGAINLKEVKALLPAMTDTLVLEKARLVMFPAQATLENMRVRFGASDLEAEGRLENLIAKVLGGAAVKGTATVRSHFLDLTPFLGQQGGAAAVELPGGVELTMEGKFDAIAVGQVRFNDVRGRLLLRDKTLNLVDLRANCLGGEIITSGQYRYLPPEKPHVDLDLHLSRIGIPDMFQTFMTVKRFAPIAGYMRGACNGTLRLSTDLGDSLAPVLSTLSSQGSLEIPEASIVGFPPLNRVADALAISRLRDPSITGIAPTFQIKDGFFYLNPLSLKIGGYNVVASGANGLDRTLSYTMRVNIPASEIKAAAGSPLLGLVGERIASLTDEDVVVDVKIGGLIDDPKISTSFVELVRGTRKELEKRAIQQAQSQLEELKQQQQQKLEETQQATKDTVQAEVQQKLEEAKKKAKEKLEGLFKR